MRISLARCAPVLLLILFLVGCQTSGSSWYRPSFSMSKLNPFSSSADELDAPAKPAELASPTLTMPPGAGYAAASSATSGETGYPSTPSSYEAPPSGYPTTSADALSGGPQAAASPATTPQSGYYSAGSYGLAGQSGARTSPYGAAASPSSRSAPEGYRTAGITGPYGSATSTAAPRYGTIADRYGTNQAGLGQPDGSYTGQGAATADPYQGVRGYASEQTQTPRNSAPRYGGADSGYGAVPDSRYEAGADSARPSATGSGYPYGPAGATTSGSRYDSGQRYGAGSDSLVGDRYADAASADAACDTCSTGQPGDSAGPSARQPGDTGYQPGGTGYQPGGPTANMPGRTKYDWGNTGYNPPGVSPYRSPADSYTSPYLPGSTKPYTPRGEGYSDAPTESRSGSTGTPKSDSYVIPASHRPRSPATEW